MKLLPSVGLEVLSLLLVERDSGRKRLLEPMVEVVLLPGVLALVLIGLLLLLLLLVVLLVSWVCVGVRVP